MQFCSSSFCKLHANLQKNGTDFSISTVLCCLSKEFGLKSYKPAAKQRLTSDMEKKRNYL